MTAPIKMCGIYQLLLTAISKAKAHFTHEQQGQMAALRSEGKTLKQIGAIFGIKSESSVHLNVKRWRDLQAAP